MVGSLIGRSLLTLKDYSTEEIKYLIELSILLKRERESRIFNQRFKGRTLAMLFEKRSTRTRCAFETAFGEEGGHPVFLSKNDIQLGQKETIEDTARVLGSMFDAIMFRGFKQEFVEVLSQYSGIPVYNALTDMYHPTQVLADLMTVLEIFGKLKGINFVYAGDGRNNMANSLLIGCAKMGVNFTCLSPKELMPAKELVDYAKDLGNNTASKINISDNVDDGIKGADVIYTDVWASMGEESSLEERKRLLQPYQVNEQLMKKTGNRDTVFMHCLPAVKGNEVTEDVFEGFLSVVFQEAENRKHTIKATMVATIS
ncbi:MAG: ornithine carbamoyltransferase [Spirochaetota bacterium]